MMTHCHITHATHCNTLQHTATHCNKLQHTATHCNTLQHTWHTRKSSGIDDTRSTENLWATCVAVCCSVLQCVAVCCRVLQSVNTQKNLLERACHVTIFSKEPFCLWSRNPKLQLGPKKLPCSMLQCVSVCCSVLQYAAVCCSMLQCVLVCCSVLQYAAVCCSMLQYVAVRFSMLQYVAVCCIMLQYVSVCCSAFQYVEVRCSILQYVAVCCSAFQYVAVCCSMLQYVAVNNNEPIYRAFWKEPYIVWALLPRRLYREISWRKPRNNFVSHSMRHILCDTHYVTHILD